VEFVRVVYDVESAMEGHSREQADAEGRCSDWRAWSCGGRARGDAVHALIDNEVETKAT
jgi:hypothetical protein